MKLCISPDNSGAALWLHVPDQKWITWYKWETVSHSIEEILKNPEPYIKNDVDGHLPVNLESVLSWIRCPDFDSTPEKLKARLVEVIRIDSPFQNNVYALKETTQVIVEVTDAAVDEYIQRISKNGNHRVEKLLN
jgi:hypothetical protein